MKRKTITLSMMLAGLMSAGNVLADHNSPMGEGWASMPNDIHNTRIDTMDGDNQEFIDFVRQGNGADSVNRFDDTTTTSGMSVSRSASGVAMARGGAQR